MAPATVSAVGLLACMVLLSLTPSAQAGASEPRWVPSANTWTNGVVLCNFSSGRPSAEISRFGLTPSGIVGELTEVVESSSAGPVARAEASAANWTATNLSDEDQFEYSYAALAAVEPTNGSRSSLGTAEIQVDFILASYAGSPTGNMTSVALDLRISNWSWQAPGDRLAVELALWPADPGTEHLEVGNSGSSFVASVSNSSGRTLEYFEAGEWANVSGPSPSAVPAAGELSLTPSWAWLTVGFGSGAGEFRTLDYVSHVGIVLPPSVAGIPTDQLALVGGAAALVAAGIAIATRQIRRKPSDIEYIREAP
ncbi:MAG TPA: hypothetical protein VLY85_04915 [Thermoplasmata archaeon]|nr:hypothetical protein [Thermoplasmata archaeon]